MSCIRSSSLAESLRFLRFTKCTCAKRACAWQMEFPQPPRVCKKIGASALDVLRLDPTRMPRPWIADQKLTAVTATANVGRQHQVPPTIGPAHADRNIDAALEICLHVVQRPVELRRRITVQFRP